jgi:hypothetical protein
MVSFKGPAMRRLYLGIVVMAASACASDPIGGTTQKVSGEWGAVDAQLSASPAAVILTMGCAVATIPGTIPTAPNGTFSANGTISAAVWKPFVGRIIRLSGTAYADSISINFTSQDLEGAWGTELTHYTLLPGQHPTYPDGKLCSD